MEMILENVDEWMKMDETEWSAKGWIRRENGHPGHKNLSSNETHTFGSEMSFLNVWVEIHVDFFKPLFHQAVSSSSLEGWLSIPSLANHCLSLDS